MNILKSGLLMIFALVVVGCTSVSPTASVMIGGTTTL
ncbi:Uncharacterised protein [Moraxella veridica]|nr:Uncharacterised protein [Moraxella catarrhalis]